MSPVPAANDLIVLAADRTMELVLKTLLLQHQRLRIRKVDATFIQNPDHDPGAVQASHVLLRSWQKRSRYALVVFDRKGCGREQASREELESQVETQLAGAGWEGRSAAVVIDPMLEVWVWSDSPHVATALGWSEGWETLKNWLVEHSHLVAGATKPTDPKRAMQSVCRQVKKPFSGAIHRQLAETVSFERCSDPAFHKLKLTLRTWFPRV